jgi:hypothetical protein
MKELKKNVYLKSRCCIYRSHNGTYLVTSQYTTFLKGGIVSNLSKEKCSSFILRCLFSTLLMTKLLCMMWGKVMATGWMTEGSEFEPSTVMNFLFSAASGMALRIIQPPIQQLGALSLGIKQQEREADHSPPNIAEVIKTWIYTSTAPYTFKAWCLIS